MNLRLKVGASNPPWGKGWPTAAILRWGSKSCASLAGESGPQSIKAVEKLGRLLGNTACYLLGGFASAAPNMPPITRAAVSRLSSDLWIRCSPVAFRWKLPRQAVRLRDRKKIND